ncbi:hypothetical protein [Bacteroidetes bacterium endosymbiont of Geopemphigus sp.]|uniref:hypothetical protein n=1 Tax=Bacteroidetes bacterium endosymbiont of Geopemphigus sp. TaxID=2047937 RepID=UPI000CD05D49|nr:hypothetical protein [Bacteroidetes bacterium endosymbiont of Geopemphigus sp.]
MILTYPLNSIRILGREDKIDDSLKENLISNLNTALDIAQSSYEGEMRKIMDRLITKGGIQKGIIANHGNPTDIPFIKSLSFI